MKKVFTRQDSKNRMNTTSHLTVSPAPALQAYYDYWEAFFQAWKRAKSVSGGTYAILGWNDPDPSLLNTLGSPLDLSSDYVPEPWWGNDGTGVLHSVVINLNPGSGKDGQLWRSVAGIPAYADLVNGYRLKETINWHFTERAFPMLSALYYLNKIPLSGLDFSNNLNAASHFSMELIPWHTASAARQYGYDAYIRGNLIPVFKHCISFAAEQSKRIANGLLKNTVVIKTTDARIFGLLLNPLSKLPMPHAIKHRIIQKKTRCPAGGNSYYMTFEFPRELPGITFACVWNSVRRNSLPSVPELSDILLKI